LEKYQYDEVELKYLEEAVIPFAVYQFVNKRVVTLILSQGFMDLFGFENDPKEFVYDLMDNNMYRDTHPDDLAFLGDAAYHFATEGGSYDVIYRSLVHGEYRIIHAYGKHVYKTDGTRLAFIWYTDQGHYTEEGMPDREGFNKVLNESLIKRSASRRLSHDYLTGLPSMTYFFELADEGCNALRKQGKKPAILFFDFNGMKSFNQKYGLAAGDELLIKFKDILIRYFSHENCSRFSADHFCVYSEFSKALEAAQKIINDIKTINEGISMPLRVGLFDYDDVNITISGACDRAKIACDSDRKTYDSRIYFFNKEMMDRIVRHQYIVENIDKAIENGWIKAFYQPVIRTSNGSVCAEEALARWDDPEKGFLSPGDFIPALEEANAIYKLDLYMVDCILKKMKQQADNGLYVVPESVNLSRSDFYFCDIVEEVRKRVDGAGIQRDRLVIEITESSVADDIEYMTSRIKRFKELGFTVWMDDYGSGYSSPIILQKIPFDLIKIDMLFVRMMNDSEKARIILTEIVRMAMLLGLDTIAEGVETKEQVDFLKDIGCARLQGFYFCKPVSLDEIIDRYRNGVQIGFENPAEATYYDQLGKVNLYDLTLYRNDDKSLDNYFDTWPMAIVECDDEQFSMVRCNSSFRDFYSKSFTRKKIYKKMYGLSDFDGLPGYYTVKAIFQCAEDGNRIILDDKSDDGKVLQIFLSRVAVNPVTHIRAIAMTILSAKEPTDLMKEKEEFEKLKRERMTYSRIIALSGDYIAFYVVDPETEEYHRYSSSEYYDAAVKNGEGENFSDYALNESKKVVYYEDLPFFQKNFRKDKVINSIKKQGMYILNYRHFVNNRPVYVQLKANMVNEEGKDMLIIGILNVDHEVRREQEYATTLSAMRAEVDLDELTGVKSKHAYVDMEMALDMEIEKGMNPEFALAVFDINSLKEVNDSLGHQAGDQYIIDGCNMICGVFKHSPVYRVGGDEFAVIVQGTDYRRLEDIMDKITKQNEKNKKAGKVVVAAGIARYSGDNSVAAVFKRADENMYTNKRDLKA